MPPHQQLESRIVPASATTTAAIELFQSPEVGDWAMECSVATMLMLSSYMSGLTAAERWPLPPFFLPNLSLVNLIS